MQFITAWGEYFFQSHQLHQGREEGGDGNDDDDDDGDAAVSVHQRALTSKLQMMRKEVSAAVAEWGGQAQV